MTWFGESTPFRPGGRRTICRPPPPTLLQFWSHFHERFVMCWNEWENDFPIFIFRVIVKIHRKLTIFRTKKIITRKTTSTIIRNSLAIFTSFSAHKFISTRLTSRCVTFGLLCRLLWNLESQFSNDEKFLLHVFISFQFIALQCFR